jgi:hypothetical protein
MSHCCYVCDDVLADDCKKRVRVCPRKCAGCKADAVYKRLKTDPVAKIQRRLYNALRKVDGDVESTIWSRETVDYVLRRWERKSAISGDDDLADLTITPYKKGIVDSRDDLVLVTSKEAHRMGRMNPHRRRMQFPQHVQQEME